jgi:hypothetical protein
MFAAVCYVASASDLEPLSFACKTHGAFSQTLCAAPGPALGACALRPGARAQPRAQGVQAQGVAPRPEH